MQQQQDDKNTKVNSVRLAKLPKIATNFIQELIQLGKLDSSIHECVFALLKEPTFRKQSDIDKIKSFLESTALATKFRSDNFNAESLDKILFMCSREMKHYYLEKGKVLFHIGDIGDRFYIVLQGKIAVLQPRAITDQMSGFEYYRHLYMLRKHNEKYMLNLTIEANRNIVDIDSKDIDNLHLILLVMCMQDYFSHVNFVGRTITEILTLCGVDAHYFDGIIDDNNVDIRNPNLLEHIERQIFERLPKFDQTVIQRYHILSNNVVSFKVNLFEYKNIIELGKGSFFGDTALDKLTTRNATIKTTDDTHFCYLGNHHYNSYIRLEKQRLTNKEISFLVDNFFFKNIPYRVFEQRSFANFYYGERTKGEIICKENQPLEHLYFIKEGIIELTMKQNIPELYETVTSLSKLNFNVMNTSLFTVPPIYVYPRDHVAKTNLLSLKSKMKVYNYSQKEVIGLESLCYGLNYLYTAEVISDKVKLYKVHKSYVIKMLKEDETYYERFQYDGSKKMIVYLKRLIELYHTKLEKYEKTTKKHIYANIFSRNIDRSSFGKCTNDHFEYCPVLKVFKEKNTKLDMNDQRISPTKIRVSSLSSSNVNCVEQKRSPYFTSIPVKKHKGQIRYRNTFVNDDNKRMSSNNNNNQIKTISFPSIITNTNQSHTFTVNNEESVFSLKKEEQLLRKLQYDIDQDNLIYSTILSNKMISRNGVDLEDLVKEKEKMESVDNNMTVKRKLLFKIGDKRSRTKLNVICGSGSGGGRKDNRRVINVRGWESGRGDRKEDENVNSNNSNNSNNNNNTSNWSGVVESTYNDSITQSYSGRRMKNVKLRFMKPKRIVKIKHIGDFSGNTLSNE